MADPSPIPAEALEAAAKVALRRYESEYSVAPNVTWRDFVAEVQEMVEAAAPALLAAGRTAAAELANARWNEGHRAGWIEGRAEGLDAGRSEAAVAIRAKAARYSGEQFRHFQMCARIADGQGVPATRQDAAAARVAENGADPQRPVERTAEVALDCGGCGDTIWPTEHVYEFGDGRVRCVICQVKSSGKGADQ